MKTQYTFRAAFAFVALCLMGLAAPAQVLDRAWDLNPDMSNIRFQSIKNESKVESSEFATLAGSIDQNGAGIVRVALDSVDTKIDLRNVRMRFLFFETFKFPEAEIRLSVTPAMLDGLADQRRKTLMVPFDLDLHGVRQRLQAELVVTLLGDDRVSVASAAPVSVATQDFGLRDNVTKLEEAAGGITILPSATVTFDFVFDAKGQGQAAAALAAIAPGAAALEAEGDFSREACIGRFEILSRTGNIYFRSGSAALDSDSIPLLNGLLDIVERCPDLNIEVAGHTDSTGSAALNQSLSEARARSVAAWLAGNGVQGARLVVAGYGENRPVASNDIPNGRAKNRRIEFVVAN